MGRPNILLVIVDQLRADWLSCYGVDWLATPSLDRLASAGTRFSQCIVNNPICTPSRASILTGKEVPGHGVFRLKDVLPDHERLVSEQLRRAGYRTALFGKLHVSARLEEEVRRHPDDGFEVYEWCHDPCVGLSSPFNAYACRLEDRDPERFRALLAGRPDGYRPEPLHLSTWAADRASDYIREMAARGQRFFCMMSLFDPHDPYDDYPIELLDRVDQARLPLAAPLKWGMADDDGTGPGLRRKPRRSASRGNAEDRSGRDRPARPAASGYTDQPTRSLSFFRAWGCC